MKIIIDDNLKLELINKFHADELFALTDKNRKFLRKWLPWVDGTRTVNDTIDFIKTSQKQFKKKKGLQLAIKYKNKLCGMVGLVIIDNYNKKTEVGYWLAKKYNGKGIMTRSCKALVEYCFKSLSINKINIRCAPGNKPSIGIPLRLNFKKEALLRDDTILNNKFEDSFLFTLLRREWDERK